MGRENSRERDQEGPSTLRMREMLLFCNVFWSVLGFIVAFGGFWIRYFCTLPPGVWRIYAFWALLLTYLLLPLPQMCGYISNTPSLKLSILRIDIRLVFNLNSRYLPWAVAGIWKKNMYIFEKYFFYLWPNKSHLLRSLGLQTNLDR